MATLLEAIEANKRKRVQAPPGLGNLYEVGELVKVMAKKPHMSFEFATGVWTIQEPLEIYVMECSASGKTWFAGFFTKEELELNRQPGYSKGVRKFVEVVE